MYSYFIFIIFNNIICFFLIL